MFAAVFTVSMFFHMLLFETCAVYWHALVGNSLKNNNM